MSREPGPDPHDDEAIDAMLRAVPHPDPADQPELPDDLGPWLERGSAAEGAELDDRVASAAWRDFVDALDAPLPDELVRAAERAMHPRRRHIGWAVGAVLAAAAAVLVFTLRPQTPEHPQAVRMQRPGLPVAYRLAAVEGGIARARAVDEPARLFAPGAEIRLWLTPTVEQARFAAAAALFEVRDGALRPLDSRIVLDDGAFELAARLDPGRFPPGRHTLAAVLALDAAQIEGLTGVAPDAVVGARIVPVHIEIQPPEGDR